MVFYVLGGLGIMLLMFPNNMMVNLVFVAFAGIGSISTSLVLTGYIADYYPANIRGTATGWALSFARIGAISGPLIGGWIGSAKLPFEYNFAIFAGIAVVAAGAVAMIPKRRVADPVFTPELDGSAEDGKVTATAYSVDATLQTEFQQLGSSGRLFYVCQAAFVASTAPR